MSKPLLVIGGNGLLGTAICKYAVSQGKKCISLSRSTNRKYIASWQESVDYIQGDAMNPETYESIVPTVAGVVHTVGTLIDSRTPLKIKDTYIGSYEHLNRDTALKVLGVVEKYPRPFVFVSAAKGWFFLPGYIETKREVEEFLERNKHKFTYTVLRPGLFYDKNETRLVAASHLIDLVNMSGRVLNSLGVSQGLSVVPAKSLDVELVAKAAVESVYNPKLWNKILEVRDIENFA